MSLTDKDVVTPTLPEWPLSATQVDELPNRVVFVRSAYNYDMELASDDSGLKCMDVSRAVQSSRDEVDINTIVRRFGLTGQLPHDLEVPQYADFDAVHDFHSAMNLVAEARDAFMAMPADVRSRFENDPDRLVAFVSDPGNLEEARALGIAVAKAPDVVDPVVEAIRALKPSEHLHDPVKPV